MSFYKKQKPPTLSQAVKINSKRIYRVNVIRCDPIFPLWSRTTMK